MNEDELRDALAAQIESLEPGLILVEKEKYVPNELGTRGFIDLFARDAAGHFVLIELKRSNAAAREAIHEVLKYVEGVKAHLGAREHEIRVFIASTEWKELLVPFSRFVSETRIAVHGLNLTLNNGRITTNEVQPIQISKGRLIAPWHELNLYRSEADLQRGLREYENSCKKKGIDDFVLVVLDAPAGFNDAAHESFRKQMRNMAISFGDKPDEAHIDELTRKLDHYTSIIYFGMQMLDRKSCLEIIAKDGEQNAEIEELLPDMEDEEALCYLHETIYSIDPRPHQNGYEIGYPAKFRSRILDQEGWKIRK